MVVLVENKDSNRQVKKYFWRACLSSIMKSPLKKYFLNLVVRCMVTLCFLLKVRVINKNVKIYKKSFPCQFFDTWD